MTTHNHHTALGSSLEGADRIRAAEACSVPSYEPENRVTAPDPVTPLASQAAIARALGLSRKTMTVWKQSGYLVMAGDLVDLAATAAQLRKTHRDGVSLAEKLIDLVTHAVTPEAEGNAPAVTRPILEPYAEAVVSFAERIAKEGGHCAWEAGITRAQADVADRLFREGLITDAAEHLDERGPAAPGGAGWLAEPVWSAVRDARLSWSVLEAQRAWEVIEGFSVVQSSSK
jgi:hypothetical protein